jgi:threonine/homoserine/homoserine lactone efflux protein
MVLLGGLFIVATILIFGGISVLAGAFGARFRESARARRILNWLAGSVFAGLALKLALSER